MLGGEGFGPQLPDAESGVLPLDDLPIFETDCKNGAKGQPRYPAYSFRLPWTRALPVAKHMF
jgi:hypothetical protein